MMFSPGHSDDCPVLTSVNLYVVKFTEIYSMPTVRFAVLVRNVVECMLCECIVSNSNASVVTWGVLHLLI